MYIIGIDIGKNHHEASIVSSEGKQIGHSLRFASTHKGADSLMNFIFKNIGNSPCIFAMEATGHYWYPIYSFLKAKGYTVSTVTLYPYNYPSRCHSFEKRIHFSKPTSHLLIILPHICHSSYNFSPVFSAGISITGIRYSVPLFSIP